MHRCHNCTSLAANHSPKTVPAPNRVPAPYPAQIFRVHSVQLKKLSLPHPSTINHLVCPIALQFLHLSRAPRLFGFPWWLSGKESACQHRRCGLNPRVRKIPWRRVWQPTPVFLPGKSHGRRRQAGSSPWDCKRVRHDLATKQQQPSLLAREQALGQEQPTLKILPLGASWGVFVTWSHRTSTEPKVD